MPSRRLPWLLSKFALGSKPMVEITPVPSALIQPNFVAHLAISALKSWDSGEVVALFARRWDSYFGPVRFKLVSLFAGTSL